ncbi:MAG: COX15/CtaA family protein [Hyphomicrobiaceae bacterium]
MSPSLHQPRGHDDHRPIRAWLYAVAGLVALTAIVGAATRLTGSGLSITEWNVIGGMVPPLNDAQWTLAFDKYRQIPQYREINRGMSLDAFKVIFWWEWAHRMLARFIGAAFAVPLIVFALLGRLPSGFMPRLMALLGLGALQGFVGWYMVSSGLVDRTDVSQYRLALHLGLAVLIFALLIWTALDLSARQRASMDLKTITRRGWIAAHGVLGLVYLQVLAGALVAGLKAGRTHNTWPLMDGALMPAGLMQQSPWWCNLFENATTVQFNHRALAYVIVGVGLWHAWAMAQTADAARVRHTAMAVGALVVAQTMLGIWTLLAWVPLWLGVVHQIGALATVAAAVAHVHALRTTARA